MPNHCYNKLTIQSTQSDIDEVMEHLRGEQTMFDFNNLVPMPEVLKDTHSVHIQGKQYFYSVKKWNDTPTTDPTLDFPQREWLEQHRIDDFTVKRLENQHGTADWYDWSIANWGTKWNAYEVEYSVGPIPNASPIINGRELSYSLVPAWAEPRPIISALIEYLSLPNFSQHLEMRWRFRDETEHYDGEINNRDKGA